MWVFRPHVGTFDINVSDITRRQLARELSLRSGDHAFRPAPDQFVTH